MNVTARRRYPLLLLRDTRGRFARLRRPLSADRPATRRRCLPRVRLDAVQLVLF
jgi:hypothetical protein